MATSTTNYSFSLPEVGGDTDQWGAQLNANWTSLDSTLKTVADSVGDDVTLTGNDYLTISGQAITVGDIDLTADVTGTLPVESGGTGLASLGSANQVLGVNSSGTSLEFQNAGSGTVTSVAVTGSDGIEVDSGSPITASGTIALGVNATTLSTHLGLGSLATQSSVTESQISDLGSYITASSTDTLTNKSGNISQWTNDSGYLTAETNNLSTVSGTLGTANGGTGLTAIGTANQVLAVNSGATALEFQTISVTESQISDFGTYQTADAGLTSIAGLTTAADKMLYTTAADTYAVTTLTTAGRALLDDADAAAQRTTLGLGSAATSNTSAFEAAGTVSTHAALTEVHGISAFGATLVDDADAPAARTTLGLGSLATQSSITESQISDLQSYLTAETNDLGSAVTGTLGTANGGTGLTAIGTAGQVLTVNSGATALEYQTPLVALPITDSAGNNVLSESSGVVTLTADEANVGSNALVVNSSGNVGIGTNSPSSKLHIKNNNVSNTYLTAENNNGSGILGVGGANQLEVANTSAGDVAFFTSSTERMRIDSSGDVQIGGVSNLVSAKLDVHTTSGTLASFRHVTTSDEVNLAIQHGYAGLNYANQIVFYNTNFAPVGSIRSNGSATQFNTSSDYRLKENITEITDGIARVKQLNPSRFNFIANPENTVDGFIAHEVQPIVPEAISGEKDAVNEDGSINPQGLDLSKLVPLLTAALQESIAKIESLETRIAQLESK